MPNKSHLLSTSACMAQQPAGGPGLHPLLKLNKSDLRSTTFQAAEHHADGVVLRLPQVIAPHGLLPFSKSTLYAKIKAGELPPPIKLGPRISVWRKSDIIAFIEKGEQR